MSKHEAPRIRHQTAPVGMNYSENLLNTEYGRQYAGVLSLKNPEKKYPFITVRGDKYYPYVSKIGACKEFFWCPKTKKLLIYVDFKQDDRGFSDITRILKYYELSQSEQNTHEGELQCMKVGLESFMKQEAKIHHEKFGTYKRNVHIRLNMREMLLKKLMETQDNKYLQAMKVLDEIVEESGVDVGEVTYEME